MGHQFPGAGTVSSAIKEESQEEPKQLGCIVHSILPAAIANAIAHALQKTVHTVPVPIDYIYKEVMS